jgi:hypothetical protein
MKTAFFLQNSIERKKVALEKKSALSSLSASVGLKYQLLVINY